MIFLQFTAGQGPVECQRAVVHAVARFTEEARTFPEVSVTVLESEKGEKTGTLRSALLALEGKDCERLAQQWVGVLQWISPSLDRPGLRRKNWFVGVGQYQAPDAPLETSEGIRFETCRASGAGGQHVNRTESAVRAIHVASGLAVRVESERSQHANRSLALALLRQKLAQQAEEATAQGRRERRQAHHQLERGSPLRVFRGPRFEEDILSIPVTPKERGIRHA